jgi:hypothetical protein
MKPLPLVVGFLVGSGAAVVIGLALVVPAARHAWQVNVDSDVHRPLEGALQYIEKSAAEGDWPKATVQLRLLNKRFAEYRAGGALPSDWYQEVIAATRPAP